MYAWNLGAITPDAATAQVLTTANAKKYGQNPVLASAQAGQMLDSAGAPAYIPGTPDCSAAAGSGQSGNVKLAQMATGLALQGINVAAAVSATVAGAIGVALGPLTMGISTLIGLFPLLFGHHAAAVKKEQSVLCSAVPAANNYLQIIDQGVQSGMATPQQGISALNSLLADFRSAVSSIEKDCNAACVMTDELQAIILVKQSEYQDIMNAAAPAAQLVTSARPNTTAPASAVPASSYASFYTPGALTAAPAPSSFPSWLPIAALVGVGFLLFKGDL